MTGRPLEGCRVLDLGILTAGAATSALLADLGADVIKVESKVYRDPFRQWPSGAAKEEAEKSDLPPFYRATNRNKRSLGLNLKHPEGRAVFMKLAARSDIVVENFRRGVMASLGLDFPALQRVNPAIILASLSSQGESGPDADRVSFGSTLEASGGLAWLTGYAGGDPTMSGIALNYADQVVAIFAAGMVVSTLLDRRKHGAGCHLEISQRELISFLCGESFVAPGAESRHGNAEAPWPIQDCFRTADGCWIAITVSAERRTALESLVGCIHGGITGNDATTAALRGWIGARNSDAALAALDAAGIICAPVLDGAGALAQGEALQRDAVVRAPDGKLLKGFPFTLEAMAMRVDADARALGADSARIMSELGGYPADEIARLVKEGIVEFPG